MPGQGVGMVKGTVLDAEADSGEDEDTTTQDMGEVDLHHPLAQFIFLKVKSRK